MVRDAPVCSRRLSPLGVAVEVTADDPRLLATACAAYADGDSGEDAGNEPAVIRLHLSLGGDDGEDAAEDIQVDGARLALSGAGIEGWADAATGRAECVVPPRLLDRPGALAAEAADTLLLFLLTRTGGRPPVHAAGVRIGGQTLVLAGPSGSGKSTLALAALDRGLQILSDDTLYIQLRPKLRVWGLRRPLHVFPADAPRFTGETRLRSGRLKAVVPLPEAGAWPTAADTVTPVLLARGEQVALERLDAGEAAAGLMRLDPGFDLLRADAEAAAQALAAGGGWRLTLSRRPEEAIGLLVEQFGRVR